MNKHVMECVDLDDGGSRVCLGCRQFVYGNLTEAPPGECPTPYKSQKQLLAESVARETALNQRVQDLESLSMRLIGKVRTVSKIRPDGIVNGRDLLATLEREAQSCQPLPGREGFTQEVIRKNLAYEALCDTAGDLAKFIGIVDDCFHLASSYSPCLDSVDENGGDDHEDPTCAIYHRLYYAMFMVRKSAADAPDHA